MGSLAYFDEHSMLHRVQGEQVLAQAGPRALLMMAAHPVAFAGFFAHTGALEDPYRRLERTAALMSTIAYGPRELADAGTARVRAIHARISGELREPVGRFAAGTPYRADDPGLLLWVLAALVDSSVLVYEKYVRRLTRAERDAYWEDWRLVGRLFGLRDDEMPENFAAFHEYMRAMLESGDLHVGPQARELAVDIVLRPPVPLHVRPLLELSNQITFGLLPPSVRRLYGFSWDPLRSVALHGGAEYVKRVLVPVLPARLRLTTNARAWREASAADDGERGLDGLRDVA